MSEVLKNKIDFVEVISVTNANPNGDPLNGNRPRSDYEGYGEISDVAIKRKIRNRMQDLGNYVFVQSRDRADDGYQSLSERANKELDAKQYKNNNDGYAAAACEKWIDVRSFGQVFAFKSEKKGDGISCGVRGPVSIHQAESVNPIEIESMQITKSVNGESSEKKASDTMGTKHFVRFGMYVIKGSINVQLAEKTGFTEDDAETVKECLRTLFVNDASAARPDGSMEVVKLFWFKHNCKDGSRSSAKVHRSVSIALKDGVEEPKTAADYEITCTPIDGVEVQEIEGI